MGYGDPYHKHPLRNIYEEYENYDGGIGNCFHCELPITDLFSCYGCTDCDYHIHEWCQDLPITLSHPLHDLHSLTRFEPPSSSNSSNLCKECQNHCLGRFAYQCVACQLFFHLKCLFTLNHEKHHHPLIFSSSGIEGFDCNICGYLVCGFNFGCSSCKFHKHPWCTLIPVRVKRHHVHELTLRHNFPQECDQVYCDLCEDKDGELDPELSYYYCKRCDYIAHVHCCITQPRDDSVLYESFIHEHPLKIPGRCESMYSERFFCCNVCDYQVSFWSNNYPSLIKHPIHPEHTLVVDQESDDAFYCTECEFTMDNVEGVRFTHPLWRPSLEFKCKNSLFRCDACGELGKGSRVGDFGVGKFDLHLECLALPGKLEHESHPRHPLYLRWLHNISTSRYCSVCTEEMDPQLWFYFCQECDYATHINCVARDLLLTFRSSIKNQPNFCAIIEPDKTMSFVHQIADCRPREAPPAYHCMRPVLMIPGDNDGEANCDLGIETIGDAICCPKCNLLISNQARHSTIKEWESSQFKYFHDQTPSESEPLNFLDEKKIDELYCSICNVFIFPPTYSCTSCQFFFS